MIHVRNEVKRNRCRSSGIRDSRFYRRSAFAPSRSVARLTIQVHRAMLPPGGAIEKQGLRSRCSKNQRNAGFDYGPIRCVSTHRRNRALLGAQVSRVPPVHATLSMSSRSRVPTTRQAILHSTLSKNQYESLPTGRKEAVEEIVYRNLRYDLLTDRTFAVTLALVGAEGRLVPKSVGHRQITPSAAAATSHHPRGRRD